MRDALRTDDQESYFRVLSSVDLLLPVSADALAGQEPLGWGTWSTGGRTHVLAFTSSQALQSCLSDYSGSARRVPYAELAETWPNLEWWLAVNPGLPVEGYLPAWFVAQLSRGDLRLPTRGPGREPPKIQDLHAAAVAHNAAATGAVYGQVPGAPGTDATPVQPAAAAGYGQPAYDRSALPNQPVSGAAPAGYGQPGQQPGVSGVAAAFGRTPGQGAAAAFGQTAAAFGGQGGGGASNPPAAQPGSPAAASAYGQSVSPGPSGYGQAPGSPAAPLGYGQPGVPAAYGQPGVPAGYGQPGGAAGSPAAYGQPASAAGSPASNGQPGAAPTSHPGAAAASPYGQPSGPAGHPGGAAGSSPYGQGGYGQPATGQPGGAAGSSPYGQPATGQPGGAAASSPYGQGGGYGQPAGTPTSHPGATTPPAYGQPAVAPTSAAPPPYGQTPGARLGGAFAPPSAQPPAYGQPAARPTSGAQPPADYAPSAPAKPEVGPGGLPIRSPGAVNPTSGLPTRSPSGPAAAPSGRGWDGESDPRGALPNPSGPLPVRTPMAQTPPVPDNFAPHNPDETPFEPRWSSRGAAPSASSAARSDLGDLPRRNVTPPATATPSVPEPAAGAGFPQGPASPAAARAAQPGMGQPGMGQPGMGQPGMGQPGMGQMGQPGMGQPAAAQQPQSPAAAGPGFGSPLPRRQAGSPSASPTDMTSFPAFQTAAERAARPASAPMNSAAAIAPPARPGVVPPVIPGTAGSDRPARFPEARPLETRGATPVPAAAAPALPSRQPAAAPPASAEPFVPANDVERELHDAAESGNTDRFLSTLLLATVLVPVAHHSRPGSAPGESGFAFRTEQMDGEQFLIVFTSRDRLSEHFEEPTRTVGVRFYELIRNWPDPAWSFAVNPGSPVGAKYPGPQVIALASWATEAGLGAEPEAPGEVDPVPAPAPVNDEAQHATVMQKAIPPDQVDYYLERGYDRVAGFVHRATEVEHLRTPGELFGALGLTYDSSPHLPDAKEAYVLRWPAYRPSLYRIPYGGQNEQALKAMDGWVIERPPFRGNGFAPGEGRDVVAEFKVDSVRLPHGAQLWRLDADGNERMVAIFDNDGPTWRRVGEQ
jgi:hypothetical protein